MHKVNYAMRSHPTESGVMWTAWNSAEDATCYHDSLAAGVPSRAGIDLRTAASASIAKTLLRSAVGPKCALIEKHWPIPTQSCAGHKKLNRTQNKTINKAKPTGYKTSGKGELVFGRDFVAITPEYEEQNKMYGKTLYKAVNFCHVTAIGARAQNGLQTDDRQAYTAVITQCEGIVANLEKRSNNRHVATKNDWEILKAMPVLISLVEIVNWDKDFKDGIVNQLKYLEGHSTKMVTDQLSNLRSDDVAQAEESAKLLLEAQKEMATIKATLQVLLDKSEIAKSNEEDSNKMWDLHHQ
jgi:hypothetical protein